MAKKPRNSVSNRRDYGRSQATRRSRRKRTAFRHNRWLLVGGISLLVAAVVVFFVFLSNQSSSTINGQTGVAADETTLKLVTQIDPNRFDQIGTGGISNPFQTPQGSLPLLTGPTGKPEVFFYGAEWCPLCAAERWAVVAAMSRFGTFHTLRETVSASDDSYPNTSTFTFYQSSYTSSYLDFVPIESQDNQRQTLQTPTGEEQQLLTRYNVTGYPFMDIGDRYLITASSFDPAVLRTNPQDPSSPPLSQQEIARQLSSGNKLSVCILGTANYLTAAVCSITNNQPANVCGSSSIQHIETSLSQARQSYTLPAHLVGEAVTSPFTADVWRRLSW
ncbi:MAG TPA: DUF929 family protein [Ktedonobacteraceae bacterium]